ncbi:MAG TPA: prepilin-type N-terminal cleavage/methylation domain-containing protein [Tepidisphaeraceae bacterium]|jgi:prepilin-type N-terminal cleavage/methylation domain-containing protein
MRTIAKAFTVNNALRPPHRGRRAGLSLIECLISLAIAATLLTAVAAAYEASANAIRLNDEFFRASQAARVSINHILEEVRGCQAFDPPVDNVLSLTTNNGKTHTYAYDKDARTLTLTRDDAPIGFPATVVLARNVDAVDIQANDQSISITVRVGIGTNTITLNGSALLRRMQVFNN